MTRGIVLMLASGLYGVNAFLWQYLAHHPLLSQASIALAILFASLALVLSTQE